MTLDVLRALGPRLAHVTARSNLPSIQTHGLRPASLLAQDAGTDPTSLLLRTTRQTLAIGGDTAQLNHQRPIASHLWAAHAMLDGHSPESWAALLDHRVFFWPQSRGLRFADSIARDAAIATLWIDTKALLETLADEIDLSPINSGNFSQGGARVRRGNWIFVPVTKGLDTFRHNRVARGLVKTKDPVREVSLRRDIPPSLLETLIVDIT